jgi:hypothetical protein
MHLTTLAQLRADWKADLRAGRLPNTAELDAWRRAVTSRSPNPPLDRTDSRSAHSSSAVPRKPAAASPAGNSGRAVEHRAPALPASYSEGAHG